MTKLTIITINYNNASGLQKTMESVLSQTSKEFEYIVMDGASTDNSLKVINDQRLVINGGAEVKGIPVTCISEKDSGIYNAMNKGIRLAKGEYIQFLNSGDCLVNDKVVDEMLFQLRTQNSELKTIDILYGNMMKKLPKRILRDKGFAGRQPTMLDFYRGTLNHSPAYIRRSLFDQFGLYDETLKIVSDWKWYLQVIALNGVQPIYTDLDVTIFDMNGISNVNLKLEKEERQMVLEGVLPATVLADYKKYDFPIEQINRINQYWLTRKLVGLLERLLFKFE